MTDLLSDGLVLDLVEHIYAAGCDPDQWKTFVDRVHAAVPGSAFSVHMSIEGTPLSGFAAGIPDEQLVSYFTHYHTVNPYNDLFRKLPVGQVHTVSGLVPEGWLDHHVFYHEWLKPAGDLTYAAGLVIARDSRRLLRLSFDLPRRIGNLEKPAAQLLERLGPHLLRAFEVNERLGAVSVTESALGAMLERVDGAAFVVSSAWRVTNMNAAAEALARAGTLLKVSPGEQRITFLSPEADSAFTRLLKPALDSAVPAAATAFRTSTPPDGALVTVLPLRAAPSSFVAASPAAMALVVVRSGGSPQRVPKEMMRKLYRLTAAEAEVADLIASGLSMAETADVHAVSKATVRNQLAAAMGKMGVNRQAELVAAVAALTIKLR